MTADNTPVFIYGLFDRRGKCQYVGQTINLTSRMRGHFNGAFKKFRREWRIKIFRKTTHPKSLRIERQIGKSYKKRGECKFNKMFCHNFPSRSCSDKILSSFYSLPIERIIRIRKFLNEYERRFSCWHSRRSLRGLGCDVRYSLWSPPFDFRIRASQLLAESCGVRP